MRNKEKIIILISAMISIILITSIFFYNRYLNNKNEIKILLKAKDITKINDNKQDLYSLINEYKKEKNDNSNSKDFITDLKNSENFTTNIEIEQQNADIKDREIFNNVNSDNVILLAKLINSEAGDEPFEGKIAVANVVLYRSQESKKSIKDIIYASGQFDGVQTKLFSDNPSSESLNASKQALSGKKVLDRAYYFANLKLCNPSWATERTFLCRIGDHWFFKE